MAAEIRPATLEDAPGIARVNVLGWRWAYRGLMPDAVLDDMDVDAGAEKWARIIADESLAPPFVLVEGGDVRGYAHYGASRDEDAGDATGEVTAIYLDPEYAGRGAGWALWSRALDALRAMGHDEVTVWVLDTNERGRRFYERVGLALDGAEKTDVRPRMTIRELRYRGSLTS